MERDFVQSQFCARRRLQFEWSGKLRWFVEIANADVEPVLEFKAAAIRGEHHYLEGGALLEIELARHAQFVAHDLEAAVGVIGQRELRWVVGIGIDGEQRADDRVDRRMFRDRRMIEHDAQRGLVGVAHLNGQILIERSPLGIDRAHANRVGHFQLEVQLGAFEQDDLAAKQREAIRRVQHLERVGRLAAERRERSHDGAGGHVFRDHARSKLEALRSFDRFELHEVVAKCILRGKTAPIASRA